MCYRFLQMLHEMCYIHYTDFKIVEAFMNETRDVLQVPTNVICDELYKLHCAIIDVLILLYILVHDILVQLNDKHDIFETFNVKQLRLNIVL